MRRLPKRACAFGRNLCKLLTPIDKIFSSMDAKERHALTKQVVGSGLEELRTKQLQGEAQRQLEEEILQEAIRLSALWLRRPFNARSAPRYRNHFAMPNVEATRSECIILENEQLNSTAASSVSDEQMEAMDIVKSAGYVMSDEGWREIVFVAARSVLYKRKQPLLEITLNPYKGAGLTIKSEGRINLDVEAVTRRVGLSRERLRSTIRAASEVGYFASHPRLAPMNVSKEMIADVSARLSLFNGQGNWAVSKESVAAFISQLPQSLQLEMAEMLLKMRVLNRPTLSRLIRECIDGLDLRGARGFLTGLSPDSGNRVRIEVEQELSKHLSGRGWTFTKTIRDVFSDAKPNDRFSAH